MPRNLDLTALRSFVAIADSGGVTRAAGLLNLTQSAVSMQIKRLEEVLDLQLLDRSGRGVAPTAAGEQLLGYARRMLELNDEALARLTHTAYEGEIVLGVPHDIVYPSIPHVLQRLHAEFPRIKVQLVASFTNLLLAQFARGECHVILTTEEGVDPSGETLNQLPLVWVGAQGGQVWKQRPLRLAFEHRCRFRPIVQGALDQAGIPWEMAVEGDSSRAIEATVSADLAVHAMIDGTVPPHLEKISHGGALPAFPNTHINMYVADAARSPVIDVLAEQLRAAFRPLHRQLTAVRGGLA